MLKPVTVTSVTVVDMLKNNLFRDRNSTKISVYLVRFPTLLVKVEYLAKQNGSNGGMPMVGKPQLKELLEPSMNPPTIDLRSYIGEAPSTPVKTC